MQTHRKFDFQKLFALSALVILVIFFSIFGRNFFSASKVLTILASSYYIGFLAIGVTFVIITGGIDLSIGAVMMCSALVGGLLYRDYGLPLPVALLAVVLVGALFGLINGMLVTKLKLPPFIATLGTQMVALGAGSIVTSTTTKYFPTISEADPDRWFITTFFKTEGDFPIGVVYLIVFFAIAFVVLNRTKIGRYVYAIGSNEEAVRLSGVNAQRWKCIAYVICGLFAGLAAVFYAATYTAIIPNTGNGQELNAIAAVVIGGTSLSGGVGSLANTMIGVFIMSVLKNGLMSMDLPAPYQTFFTGLVVIGAVLLDIYRTQRRRTSVKQARISADGGASSAKPKGDRAQT